MLDPKRKFLLQLLIDNISEEKNIVVFSSLKVPSSYTTEEIEQSIGIINQWIISCEKPIKDCVYKKFKLYEEEF